MCVQIAGPSKAPTRDSAESVNIAVTVYCNTVNITIVLRCGVVEHVFFYSNWTVSLCVCSAIRLCECHFMGFIVSRKLVIIITRHSEIEDQTACR